jgi:protein O-GlcNAc transferase
MSASLMRIRLNFLLVLLVCAAPVFSQSTPAGAETHVGRGYEALKLDRYDEAVKEFRAALAIDSNLVERAQFPLAVALFELHKPEDARRELQAVRSKVGDHPNVLYYLGRTNIEIRNFAAAAEELKIAAANPPFPDTNYYLGFAYFKQNDLPSAEKWLKLALEATPRDARVPYQLGMVYQKLGREDDSRKWLAASEEIRQRDDRDSQMKTDCARKLDEGKREEAHQVCDQLYDDNNAERLMTLGTIYAQHGDPQGALKPLQRAAELAPQSPQMQYNLALAYFQMNEFEKARVPLETAIKRWPDLFQLSFLYGAVLLNLGDNEGAYTALRRARELNPQDATTAEMLYSDLLALAQKLANAGKYKDATAKLEEAAQLNPQDPKPHQFLSELYNRVGNSKQADAERQIAEQLNSSK